MATCHRLSEVSGYRRFMPETPPRIRLVVLFGGQSAEHDVSCVSAREMIAAADPAVFDIEPIGVGRDGTWSLADSARLALGKGPDALPAALDPAGTAVAPRTVLTSPDAEPIPTVVFPLLHGPMGEDGTVQGLLELMGVPYVGTGVLGSAVCMDKVVAKEMTAAHGIAQARYRAERADDIDDAWLDAAIEELGLPVFVKPANLGSSVGVSKATTRDEFAQAVALAGTYDEWVVVEETVVGREIECAVLGNLNMEASLPGEIIPGDTFYSYDDKYTNGVAETEVPANLTPEQTTEVRDLAIKAARALRVEGLARVDFFLTEDGRFLLNEINTMPGFTPISMYPQMWAKTGRSYSQLIEDLARLALERHERKQQHFSVER